MKLGQSFPDMVFFGRKKSLHSRSLNRFEDDAFLEDNRLALTLELILIFVFLLLFFRLFEMTIIKGGYFYSLSSGNRVREKTIPAPKGIIFDRNGKSLVNNKLIYLSCLPDQQGCSIVGENQLKSATINIDNLEKKMVREYLYPQELAHLLGYISEAGPEDIDKKIGKQQVELGDFVGKTGVESAFESFLQGNKGKELVEVDSRGVKKGSLGMVNPQPGNNLYLSVDLELQRKAYELLKDKKGAIIASIPATGEILALVSSPSFDPNKFIEGDVNQYLSDENKPLFNRAIGGIYPPGSTFKPVVVIAALEEGKIDKNTEFEDIGVIKINRFSFPNWYFLKYGKTEGMVDVVKALQRSNDIFFYRTAEALGVDKIDSWARKFGLGEKLGIEIDGESKGIIPNNDWKEKNIGDIWYLGDTYHLGIGQGYLLVTPLQVNFWTNVFANDGKICQPTVQMGESNCRSLGIKKENIGIVKEGMEKACQPGGTGWPLFNFQFSIFNFQKEKIDGINFIDAGPVSSGSAQKRIQIPVACKTGTAEYGDPKNRTHAWFTAFAPVGNPQISITVLVEGGGEGSDVAAPIAKELLKLWFENL